MAMLLRLAILVVLTAVVTGCSPEEPDGVLARPATTPATSSPSMPAVPAVPSATSAPEPVALIPAGVTLPHESVWRPLRVPGRTPLQDVCIDPGMGGLYLPQTEDYRAVASGPRAELLGVYRGPGRAHMAVAAWREQARVCAGAGSVDHVGNPMEWVVRQVRVGAADEAWQARLLMTIEGPDLGVLTDVLTIVRVGNAVYVVEDGEHTSPASARARARHGLTAARAFVPELDVFRDR